MKIVENFLTGRVRQSHGDHMKIAIAGAFGFIGQHLIETILDTTDFDIVALSRSSRVSENPRLKCVRADLYSLKDATNSLKDCDVAIYLVHSMAPNSRLAQGNFRDFDFILADNFGRAAKKNQVKSMVYVGGMIPDKEPLSTHLQSRLEVEEVLRSHSIPVTSLRCGLVIGPKGSSFSIIVNLTKRLPVMVLPSWMRTLSNPIYVGDLTQILVKAILHRHLQHRIVDVGMDVAVTYKDIVIETSKKISRSPILIDVPYIPSKISKLWVRLVSGVPKDLVYPLIDSVHHAMLKDSKNSLPPEWKVPTRPLKEAINATCDIPLRFTTPKLTGKVRKLSDVRSIQRMPLPYGKTADWIARKYMSWLPFFLKPFLKNVETSDTYEYRVRLFSIVLLSLKLDKNISHVHRQLFRVTGGLLAAKNNKGRFEFRESHDKKFVIVALHSYSPALPWVIYRWTQAIVHQVVMNRFCANINRNKKIYSKS